MVECTNYNKKFLNLRYILNSQKPNTYSYFIPVFYYYE